MIPEISRAAEKERKKRLEASVNITNFFFTVHKNYLSAAISFPPSASSSPVQLRYWSHF